MDFASLSLATNLALFAAASVAVWVAGTKLAGYADSISKRTGLSQAFLGLLLLAVATSLPEIATTVTAAAGGNARLATNNLLGGIAMQVAVLAIIDLFIGRGPLTYFTPQPVLLLLGVMQVLLLSVAIAGTAADEPLSLAGVGLFSVMLLAGYLFTLRMSHGEEFSPRWRATNAPEGRDEGKQEGQPEEHKDLPGWRLGPTWRRPAL